MTEPIRVLHFADTHIGMESYGRTDPETGVTGVNSGSTTGLFGHSYLLVEITSDPLRIICPTTSLNLHRHRV
jgi:hypothetical protein